MESKKPRTEIPTANMESMKVCVIGAGPSGTSVLRAFQSAQKKGATIPEITCYERQADLGGLWNYTHRTGIDEIGEPVHCSMYRYLWSNGPKEALEFADYTFEEHFGKPIPSYPPRPVLADYVKGRIENSGVRHWIKFHHPVRWVQYDDKTEKFTVTVFDADGNEQITNVFDYVICCGGHFSTPNVPTFPGLETYSGVCMHAHDFRDAAQYAGKNVMVVGSSYSAEDIGSQLWKYGAKTITACYRSNPMQFTWPDNWETKPLLTKVDGKMCTFKDGTSKEIDVIVLCTGYLHHFPYLSEDVRLKTDNRMWPKSLYMGIAFEANPKMLYIGMQDQFFTFNMFDAQAWWARDVILGRITIPADKATLIAASKPWVEREATLESDESLIRFQGDYVKELISLTDYPNFDIDKVCELFLEWEHHKHTDIMGYRNNCYRSVMTGKMSPVHHTIWKEELDDSMATYLKC
mmetsp:Transcript_10328/g.16900  ORF Transcript_10328/g.16900 Transcript_10328/m.16900 type:complete len:463 (-) Transcript_10328:290-1678(-)